MTKTNSSIRHLKLVTGEEVICEVLDESSDTIVVNNAMSLMQNSLKNGDKFFTFKTYMVYQDTPTNVIIIFTDKIMSLATPAEGMIEQYTIALREMASYLEQNFNDDNIEDERDIDDWLDDMTKETKENNMIDSDVNGMLMN
tara:strand:- start:130 stop:555 length:426 start_codon:yes stop_codon:yes gene_type:complete